MNGKRYDARTGTLLGSNHKPKSKPGVIMDGVVKRAPTAPASHHKAVAVPKKTHPSAGHHKGVQRPKTLMRKGLKKPHPTAKQKTTEPTILPLASEKEIQTRLKRAQKVMQSRYISRFGNEPALTKRSEPVPVAHPKAHAKTLATQSHNASKTAPHIQHFEQAINDASSHLTKFHAQKQKRIFKSKKINALSGTLAVFLMLGFFGWQNAPNLEMQVASRKAGFSASLPGYSPAGYGVAGTVQSQPGKVTVSFKSRTDDKGFSITQRASDWSSDSLLNNQLASKTNKQAWQEQGKTVYIYDGSNATWVDGGVWYQIESNASLTTDQLLRIVNSF